MNKILNNCSPAFLVFFDWAADYLLKHSKGLEIKNARKIRLSDGWCAGWCDGDRIMLAGNSPLFEETFVHEFCHMMQAVEKDPVWTTSSLFWNYLESGSININNWDSVTEIIKLERNCELRAVELSKKWKLFNNNLYSQRANLYLFFYHFVFLKKKWADSTGLYSSVEILRKMPEKIVNLDKLSKIDMNLMKIYNECLGKNGKKCKKVLPVSAALSRVSP